MSFSILSFLKTPESVRNEKNPFSFVSIPFRISFSPRYRFPVTRIFTILSFSPSDTRKETRMEPVGNLLRVDFHVGEIPHAVNRLHVLPGPGEVELLAHTGPHDPEDRVVPHPVRPLHQDLQDGKTRRTRTARMDRRDRQ